VKNKRGKSNKIYLKLVTNVFSIIKRKALNNATTNLKPGD
jgi:hypothetical protein